MAVASTELHWETDYLREASCMDKFRLATPKCTVVFHLAVIFIE